MCLIEIFITVVQQVSLEFSNSHLNFNQRKKSDSSVIILNCFDTKYSVGHLNCHLSSCHTLGGFIMPTLYNKCTDHYLQPPTPSSTPSPSSPSSVPPPYASSCDCKK